MEHKSEGDDLSPLSGRLPGLRPAVALVRTPAAGPDRLEQPDAQEEALRRFAAEHGYEVLRWYECFVSPGAANLGLVSLLQDAASRDRQFDTVLLHSRSGLFRDVQVLLAYWELLEVHGFSVVTVT